MEYLATFETDSGMEFVAVQAKGLREATTKLRAMFPDDIGADGLWTDEDGNETPINW